MRKHFGLCKRKSFRLNDFKKRIDLSNSISSVYSPAVTTVQDWNPQSRVLHGGASRLHKMGEWPPINEWEAGAVLRILFCLTWNLSMGQLDLEEPRLCCEEERLGREGIPPPDTHQFAGRLCLQPENLGFWSFFVKGMWEKKIPDFSRSLNCAAPKHLQ